MGSEWLINFAEYGLLPVIVVVVAQFVGGRMALKRLRLENELSFQRENKSQRRERAEKAFELIEEWFQSVFERFISEIEKTTNENGNTATGTVDDSDRSDSANQHTVSTQLKLVVSVYLPEIDDLFNELLKSASSFLSDVRNHIKTDFEDDSEYRKSMADLLRRIANIVRMKEEIQNEIFQIARSQL